MAYKDNLAHGGAAEAADQLADMDVGQAATSSLMLPGLHINLAHSTARAEWFNEKVSELKTADLPGQSGDREGTVAGRTLQAQMDAYLQDHERLANADTAFGVFRPMANRASQAVVREKSLQAELGFADGTDFQKSLGATREGRELTKALGASLIPISNLPSVSQAASDYETSRMGFLAWTQKYRVSLTAGVMRELRDRVKTAGKEKAEIEEKIHQVGEYADFVERAATAAVTVASLGATGGMLGPAAEEAGESTAWDTGKEMAEHGEAAVGALGQMAELVAESHYSAELSRLDAEIDKANNYIQHLEGVHTATAAVAMKGLYDTARADLVNKANAYRAAVDARKDLYARVGKAGDQAAHGGHDSAQHDKARQTMLYMEAVQEAEQFLNTGLTSGNAARDSLQAAYDGMAHRREGYQTADQAMDVAMSHDSMGPDFGTVRQMQQLTRNWLTTADTEKAKIVAPSASARGVMGEGNGF